MTEYDTHGCIKIEVGYEINCFLSHHGHTKTGKGSLIAEVVGKSRNGRKITILTKRDDKTFTIPAEAVLSVRNKVTAERTLCALMDKFNTH